MNTAYQNFVNKMLPYANQVSADLKAVGMNVKPEFIVAQWSHETGYGTNTGSRNNNFAGLWAYPSSPYGSSGKKYTTITDFMEDYKTFLTNPRYKAINNTTNVTDFARGLKAGGYATDPDYAYAKTWVEASNVASNMLSSGLSVFDINKYVAGEEQTQSTNGAGISLDKEGNKIASDLAEENSLENKWLKPIFSFLKMGFAEVIIFILMVFFIYASLVKDTAVGNTIEKAVG